ncbi:prevent-host-death family protein [Enhydrobacter aerosaccus]|uniref:Antitoxin n=2 Tax=Enhydrobacter aerosaccus TaxID=225324 RepID=A0A1T4SHD5_9HYPH|nr:type II toxin-antitoxin system prevent-host-death family antitoxin [Enhydrobacter aerosaccus]SKA27714.1 prevent-host-death family protein [Enhydrobacter aerosaccus]
MKNYSFSELMRSAGDVLDEAMKGPISLTKRGKEKLVILPADLYRRLAGHPPPQSYSVDDMPADIARELAAGLEAVAKGKKTTT